MLEAIRPNTAERWSFTRCDALRTALVPAAQDTRRKPSASSGSGWPLLTHVRMEMRQLILACHWLFGLADVIARAGSAYWVYG